MAKQPPKKPRLEWISVDTADVTDHFSVRVSGDGSLSFGMPVTNARVRTEVARAKGPKTLNEIPVDSERIFFEPDRALREFDVLVAVDTNTVSIHTRVVSVCAIVVARWTTEARDEFSWTIPYCIDIMDCTVSPERMGWAVAVSSLYRDAHIGPALRTGLIVDSELSLLEKINARKTPMVLQLPLPPGVTLMYASADAGAEFAPNFLIRRADGAASQLLDALRSGQRSLPPVLEAQDRPYSVARKVQIRIESH